MIGFQRSVCLKTVSFGEKRLCVKSKILVIYIICITQNMETEKPPDHALEQVLVKILVWKEETLWICLFAKFAIIIYAMALLTLRKAHG